MAKGTIGRAAPAKVKTAPPSTGKKTKADTQALMAPATGKKSAPAVKKAAGAGKVSGASKISGAGKVSATGKPAAQKAAGVKPVAATPRMAAKRAAFSRPSGKAVAGKALTGKSLADKAAADKAAADKAAAGKAAAGKAVRATPAASKQPVMMRAAPGQAAAKQASSAKAAPGKAPARSPSAKIVAERKAAPRRGTTKVAVPIPAARRVRKPPAPRTPAAQAPASSGKQVFTVSHLAEADFRAEGLRTYAQYRDLGIAAATAGLCQAHVIRFVPPCTDEVRKRHVHQAELQLVYVLKGWIKNEFEGYGEQMMSMGSCWIQPSGIKHTVLDYSADCEVLEIIVPADFKTEEIS